jgi:hypothetical protein
MQVAAIAETCILGESPRDVLILFRLPCVNRQVSAAAKVDVDSTPWRRSFESEVGSGPYRYVEFASCDGVSDCVWESEPSGAAGLALTSLFHATFKRVFSSATYATCTVSVSFAV